MKHQPIIFFNKVLFALPDDSSKFGEHEYNVVSSAKLETSVSWMKNIKSFIKTLNSIRPRIEPCGAPPNISR